MTQEEKAKAYDKAIGRAKESYHRFEGKTVHYDLVKLDLEDMFPELKESEDERIRKKLISLVENWKIYNPKSPFDDYPVYTSDKNTVDKILAWLEKQGEQKPANKTEPKFKVGDFLVNDYCMGKVIELTNDVYLLDTGQGIPFSCEHNVHLWTIEDAQDGDILITNKKQPFIFNGHYDEDTDYIYAYCGISDLVKDDSFYCEKEGVEEQFNVWCTNENVCPATKEQRDLLFQKMHEAGYEWNAEKKALKKIEQKPESITDDWIEDYWKHKKVNNPYSYDKGEEIQFDHQGFVRFCTKYCKKPAWSEENEKFIKEIEESLLAYKIIVMDNDIELAKEIEKEIDWLKSLKERVQLQPKQEWSEDDEEELERLLNLLHANLYESFDNWLKSIKQRIGEQNHEVH